MPIAVRKVPTKARIIAVEVRAEWQEYIAH